MGEAGHGATARDRPANPGFVLAGHVQDHVDHFDPLVRVLGGPARAARPAEPDRRLRLPAVVLVRRTGLARVLHRPHRLVRGPHEQPGPQVRARGGERMSWTKIFSIYTGADRKSVV